MDVLCGKFPCQKCWMLGGDFGPNILKVHHIVPKALAIGTHRITNLITLVRSVTARSRRCNVKEYQNDRVNYKAYAVRKTTFHMPIDVDSEAWTSGATHDRLSVYIAHRLLMDHSEKAYAVEEITDWVLEKYPDVIPKFLRKDDNRDGAVALVGSVLDRLDRRRFVTCKAVEGDDGEVNLYYKNSEKEPYYPNVRLNHEVPERFEDMERNVEKLEERLSNLEYQVRTGDSTW